MAKSTTKPKPARSMALQDASSGKLRWRMFKDRFANHFVGIGGLSAIIFVSLIFFYLAYVVIPLFQSAKISNTTSFPAADAAESVVQLAMDENVEVAAQFLANGKVRVTRLADGQTAGDTELVPADTAATSFGLGDPVHRIFAYGLADGRVTVGQLMFQVSYAAEDNKRTMTPDIAFPLGNDPIVVAEPASPITQVAVQIGEESSTIAVVTADHRVILVGFRKEKSFLDDEETIAKSTTVLPAITHDADFLRIDKAQTRLFIAAKNGELTSFDIRNKSQPNFVDHIGLFTHDERLTALRFLAGDISLLAGDNQGRITQWSLVRQDDNVVRLVKIRSFKLSDSAVTAIAPEYSRKGFAATTKDGTLGIFHTTAERTLIEQRVAASAIGLIAMAPRANAMIFMDSNGLHLWNVRNRHPEVSWNSLWSKVWYENYSQPDYLWQSSSAADDFEPKFSLVPLTFGTLKAAIYAMMIAIPLSLLGAMYTAQFMAPRMQRIVKPGIEIMQALPTVILGFLAGLWLAPFVERNLPGIFALLLFMPFGILLVAYGWARLPVKFKQWIPDGWEAAILIIPIALFTWACLAISPGLETVLFGGDMRVWLTSKAGISFDQRNAIVVGLAMGFAVVPTIFSIAEDAIFSVPKHLVQGSLALGATPWQTMIRVVLLTASPGIFSAIMIGLGRAVGETMIVLMATGNTPIMDWSPFQGLRTLSANIAVELPESEVNSTHFRILFLAGLVLFLFTFLVNTIAEIIRHRLRKKYSSL